MLKKYFNQHNADIFKDTQERIKYNEKLGKALNNSVSNQKYFPESAAINVDKNRFDTESDIVVSKSRSFEAARKYINGKDKVCVLNFASAYTPGGGVEMGALAQEESLCRISTLRDSLKDSKIFELYYRKNRILLENHKMGGEYCDDCIYTPDVMVLKEDNNECSLLPESEWYTVDVLTCAAPDLRIKPNRKKFSPTNDELAELHRKRAKKILDIAVQENADVIILGAFGCGAFKNPPDVVAKVYADIIKEYRFAFKTIEFAVYCTNDTTNYDVFNRIIMQEKSKDTEVIGFHNPDEEFGFLSNWYLSDFEVNGVRFSSMEQYMMYMKAKEFGDNKTAADILRTSDVSAIKALGRAVRNYNDLVWNGKRQVIVYEGLVQKFQQNKSLAEKLISTGNAVLAECAVQDKVWGIGLSMHDDRRFDMSEWKGQNLLGFALMMVRDKLI